MEVVIEDEVRERYGHGDIEPVDEVQATDRQEQDLARVEDAIEDLGLGHGGIRRGGEVAPVHLREAMMEILHQGQIRVCVTKVGGKFV
jgi:hypothetical protein